MFHRVTSKRSTSLFALCRPQQQRFNYPLSVSAAAIGHLQQRFKTTTTTTTTKAKEEEELASYPGARNAPFTKSMEFRREGEIFPVFHVMDRDGVIVNEEYYKKAREMLSDEKLVGMYRTMARQETMDDVLYNAQRQGRVSFYMTNYGEEAIQIGSAAALTETDEIYAQYREAGVLMYRGFTMQEFMDQCFATVGDYGKGRQMPVHYQSKKLRFQTISSPLATQIPQASGAGYVLRISGRKDICMCYFGEGAASEGDFHAALNFASTLQTQTVFFCRNNGFAISTPTSDQYHGDGIAARGMGYGIHTIRVDGNDLFAVYLATAEARRIAVEKHMPVLIEAMTYRGGHHSTSDDASRYRPDVELQYWRTEQNPINRMRKFLEREGLWDEAKEKDVREGTRKEVLDTLSATEKMEKAGLDGLVTDVYDTIPPRLQEQQRFVEHIVAKYPEAYQSTH